MILERIVSGGQTGVDRGSVRAAKALGFPYGGLIPKGRKAEDGRVPDEFTGFKEATRADYLFRTEWNVVHSDATLIIARPHYENGEREPSLEGGTKKTFQYCINHTKPRLVVFKQDLGAVMNWLKEVSAKLGRPVVLNVAGPRESKCPGIEASTESFICRVLEETNK